MFKLRRCQAREGRASSCFLWATLPATAPRPATLPLQKEVMGTPFFDDLEIKICNFGAINVTLHRAYCKK